jgi:hypothetical protein
MILIFSLTRHMKPNILLVVDEIEWESLCKGIIG